MKVAVISDIHGNMQALESVLKDIENEKCEQVFCLGDLAMAGPEPEKTVGFIKRLVKEDKLKCIQGNTDEMIGNFSVEIEKKVKSAFPIMGCALENDVKVLSAENILFLKNLPKQSELVMEGVKILLVHGSPRKNDENIFPNLSIEKVEEMIQGVDADIVFCGHTHMPCGYQTESGKTVVNDGSVGRPFTSNPQSCYVIAEFNNGGIDVKHKFVDYDKEKASDILSKRDFEGSEALSKMLINPELRHM